MAVAVFNTSEVQGYVLFDDTLQQPICMKVTAYFTKLPTGLHGFHIHKAGDLRGEGCKGACDHFDIGNHKHGGPPNTPGDRHTGDLGNIFINNNPFEAVYYLNDVKVQDVYGRSVIVHADEDDYGKGGKEDSLTTGHAGARIACAIIGRKDCK